MQKPHRACFQGHVGCTGLQVGLLFDAAASFLTGDLSEILASLEPMDISLDQYHAWIGRYRSAAAAAMAAAPSQASTVDSRSTAMANSLGYSLANLAENTCTFH